MGDNRRENTRIGQCWSGDRDGVLPVLMAFREGLKRGYSSVTSDENSENSKM